MEILEMDDESIKSLPQEIIVEILLRLPVKFLLQFRLVCKTWCSLISSPEFSKAHFHRSSTNTELTHHRLILTVGRPKFEIKACNLNSLLLDEPLVDFFDLDYPIKDPNNSAWVLIVGSCNGLVCLAIQQKNLFLWNPSTRKSKRLPDLSLNRPYFSYLNYGFGYIESADEYKVVAMFTFYRDNHGADETQVWVYTLKTDSWKRIHDFTTPVYGSGKFTNGFLHWSGHHIDSKGWNCVSFDLQNETFGEVMAPDPADGDFVPVLGVIGECLCALYNYPGTLVDLWVMKDYGNKDSWFRMATIPYSHNAEKDNFWAPLCSLKNGEIVLENHMLRSLRFLLHNSGDGTSKYIEVPNFGTHDGVHTYVESLVSPSGTTDAA